MTDWSAVQRDETRKVYEAEVAGLRKELEVARSALANATKARKTKMPAPAATRRRSGSDIVRVVIPDTHGCLIDKGALAAMLAPIRIELFSDLCINATSSVLARCRPCQRPQSVHPLRIDAVTAVARHGTKMQQIIDASSVIEERGFTVCDDLMHGFGGGYFQPILGSGSIVSQLTEAGLIDKASYRRQRGVLLTARALELAGKVFTKPPSHTARRLREEIAREIRLGGEPRRETVPVLSGEAGRCDFLAHVVSLAILPVLLRRKVGEKRARLSVASDRTGPGGMG